VTNTKSTTGSNKKKAKVLSRIGAKSIDLVIVFLAGAILPQVIGPLLGFFYSLLADGIQIKQLRGQSIGKKILGLKVVNVDTREPATLVESAIRNSPVGFATFFAIIPLWGWIILFMVGVPLMAIEVYLMMRVDTGHRLGDVMSDTEVTEV